MCTKHRSNIDNKVEESKNETKCSNCDLKDWIKQETDSNDIGKFTCQFCEYKSKNMNNINTKVIELVNKIKERGQNTAGSCAFLKTIREHGIQFASGNGMTIEELITFLEQSKDSRTDDHGDHKYVIKWN